MNKKQIIWLYITAALCLIIGLILVLNDSAAGWVFIILGISYLGTTSRTGQNWVASNPRLTRWGLVIVTLLLVLLVILVSVVILLK